MKRTKASIVWGELESASGCFGKLTVYANVRKQG